MKKLTEEQIGQLCNEVSELAAFTARGNLPLVLQDLEKQMKEDATANEIVMSLPVSVVCRHAGGQWEFLCRAEWQASRPKRKSPPDGREVDFENPKLPLPEGEPAAVPPAAPPAAEFTLLSPAPAPDMLCECGHPFSGHQDENGVCGCSELECPCTLFKPAAAAPILCLCGHPYTEHDEESGKCAQCKCIRFELDDGKPAEASPGASLNEQGGAPAEAVPAAGNSEWAWEDECTCGHRRDQHLGAIGDSECTAVGCLCEAFAAKTAAPAAPAEPNDAGPAGAPDLVHTELSRNCRKMLAYGLDPVRVDVKLKTIFHFYVDAEGDLCAGSTLFATQKETRELFAREVAAGSVDVDRLATALPAGFTRLVRLRPDGTLWEKTAERDWWKCAHSDKAPQKLAEAQGDPQTLEG